MDSAANSAQPFGIRVSLPAGDPFKSLLGDSWSKTHWYATAGARDSALREMAREHEYSRRGDKPALCFEAISRASET